MTKLLGTLTLAAMAVTLTPQAAMAQTLPFQGILEGGGPGIPNSPGAEICGAPAEADLPFLAEGQGVGLSTLGFVSFLIHKALALPGRFHGCLTLTDASGDTLTATVDGTSTGPDAWGFFLVTNGNGKFTFTGGTGRFKGASGAGTLTASW